MAETGVGASRSISAISALIIGGIYYLNLHCDRSKFADIDLDTDQGRKRIEKALEEFGHMIFHYQEIKDYKRVVAE